MLNWHVKKTSRVIQIKGPKIISTCVKIKLQNENNCPFLLISFGLTSYGPNSLRSNASLAQEALRRLRNTSRSLP